MITRIVALAALGVPTNSVSGGDGQGGNPEATPPPASGEGRKPSGNPRK